MKKMKSSQSVKDFFTSMHLTVNNIYVTVEIVDSRGISCFCLPYSLYSWAVAMRVYYETGKILKKKNMPLDLQ